MASSSSSFKKFLSASTLPNSLRLPRPTVAPPASRLFNTKAFRDHEDSADDEHHTVVDPRDVDHFFSGVVLIDPTLPRRSSLKGRAAGFSDGMRDGMSRQVKVSDLISGETEEAVQLRMEMPGLGENDVKVWVEQDTLVISGAESEDGLAGGYSSKIPLPAKAFKTDEVKAEMKNGVLKVTVPKVKEEDRKDVIHVSVE